MIRLDNEERDSIFFKDEPGKDALVRCQKRLSSLLETTPPTSPEVLEADQEPEEEMSLTKRNARERRRVRQINKTFGTLQQMLPLPAPPRRTRGPSVRKPSKVQILRYSVKYIQHLKSLLTHLDTVPAAPSTPSVDHAPLSIPSSFNNNYTTYQYGAGQENVLHSHPLTPEVHNSASSYCLSSGAFDCSRQSGFPRQRSVLGSSSAGNVVYNLQPQPQMNGMGYNMDPVLGGSLCSYSDGKLNDDLFELGIECLKSELLR